MRYRQVERCFFWVRNGGGLAFVCGIGLLGLAASREAATAREAPAPPAPAATAEEMRLLAASDLFAAAPTSFRARIEVGALTGGERTALEVWRSGRERMLVRLLAAGEQGKLFLERGKELWFFSPGTKQPVRLGPSYRLVSGLAFDELLGLDLMRTYEVTSVIRAGDVVTFALRARAGGALAPSYPAARWVVDARRGLPLRADLLLGDGRVARVLEIASFRDPAQRIPRRLIVKDLLRGAPPLAIEIVELEPRTIPEALFDPADGRERLRLFGKP